MPACVIVASRVAAHRARDPEVRDLRLAGIGDHDVAGLDVAVDETRRVRTLECLRDIGCDLGGTLGHQRTLVAG